VLLATLAIDRNCQNLLPFNYNFRLAVGRFVERGGRVIVNANYAMCTGLPSGAPVGRKRVAERHRDGLD
jgi:hypothetical protein